MFAGLMALVGAAVVVHAHSTCRHTKGSGQGFVPLRKRPCSWGEGRVCPRPPPQVSVGASPRAHGDPGVFFGLPWAVLGCPLCCCCWVCAFRCCWCRCCYGVDVVVGVATCCWGVAGGCLFRVASALWLVMLPLVAVAIISVPRPSLDGAAPAIGDPVTLSPIFWFTCGSVTAKISVEPLCVTFRLVVVSLRGPGQSPVLPFSCCVGSLLSVGRCGRCSCWCRFRVCGAQWLVCWGCAGYGMVCRLRISGAQ